MRYPCNAARMSRCVRNRSRSERDFIYRGTSLIRNSAPLRLYRRPMSRVPEESSGGRHFLMGEVPLYTHRSRAPTLPYRGYSSLWTHTAPRTLR